MTKEVEKIIAVVFWNPGEPYSIAATTIHEVEDSVRPEDLKNSEELSIRRFFEKRNIPVAVAMEFFPGFIVPAPINEGVDFGENTDKSLWLNETNRKPGLGEYRWDRLLWSRLPMDKQGLQVLANMCRLRVEAFQFDKFHDDQPQHYLSIIPVQKPDSNP